MQLNSVKRLIFIIIIFSLTLSACTLKNTDKTSDTNWKDEVLIAQSCGMDGLMCCPDKEPQCKFGQECCVDPNNSQRNYCADKCSFGTEGSYCRIEGEKCDQGLVCYEGNCVLCGGDKEPCCQNEILCNTELVCYKDKCLQCGLPGNPCCAEGRSCLVTDDSKSRLECRNKVCAFCGSFGAVACTNEPKCDEWHLLNNGLCLSCGEYNQPCCKDGDEYSCKKINTECRVGFCVKK